MAGRREATDDRPPRRQARCRHRRRLGIGARIARAFIAEGARVVLADIAVAAGRAAAAELGPAASFSSTRHGRGELDPRLGRGVTRARRSTARQQTPVSRPWRRSRRRRSRNGAASTRESRRRSFSAASTPCRICARRAAVPSSTCRRSRLIGTPTLAAYGSSKAAVRQLNEIVGAARGARKDAITLQLDPPGLRRNCRWSRRWRRNADPAATSPRRRAVRSAGLAFRRGGRAPVYLASEEARFVTGAEFVIDAPQAPADPVRDRVGQRERRRPPAELAAQRRATAQEADPEEPGASRASGPARGRRRHGRRWDPGRSGCSRRRSVVRVTVSAVMRRSPETGRRRAGR